MNAHVAVQSNLGCTVSVAVGALKCCSGSGSIMSPLSPDSQLLPVVGIAVAAGKVDSPTPGVPFSGGSFKFFGEDLCRMKICF